MKIHYSQAGLWIALCGLLSLTGCAAALIAGGAAAGAGAVVYVKGDLEKNFDQSVDSLYRASKAGLKDMEFTPKTDKKDALQFTLVSKMANDTEVTVKGIRKDNLTHLSIRVGVFGDEGVSRQILSKIESHL